MFYNLVPVELQDDFDELLNDLSYLPEKRKDHCPFCSALDFHKVRKKPMVFHCENCGKYFNPLTMTPFNRLAQPIWLGMILTRRIEKTTYSTIAQELGCTIEMVRRRDKALIDYMANKYPDFYQWYTRTHCDDNESLPQQIRQQHQAIAYLIKHMLTIKKVSCLHCESINTSRIGQRTGFRCKSCRKTFSLLSRTPINKMPHPQNWIAFIDLLVINQTNKAISETLNLSTNTTAKWRKSWCEMMKIWGYDELSVWCSKKD